LFLAALLTGTKYTKLKGIEGRRDQFQGPPNLQLNESLSDPEGTMMFSAFPQWEARQFPDKPKRLWSLVALGRFRDFGSALKICNMNFYG
jgi:hypothetical protein